MFIRNLEIKNFRNIKETNFKFSKNINIFIGKNAQGKTNVLESIYFTAITKSHRTNDDDNLIKKGELFTKIVCSYEDENNSTNELSILFNENGKKVSVNKIVQKKISDYLSRLNVIMFCPDDLEIIKGTPSVRRKYLNIEISQLRNEYISFLKDYNLVLKQRNEYLKQKKNNEFNDTYFEILTDRLIQSAIKIASYRYKFIENINENLPKVYKSLANKVDLKIKYKSFIDYDYLKKENIKDIILKKYHQVYENERVQKTTLIGVHKDDFKLYLNDLDVSEFCSQGQQRLSVISLKLSEILVYKLEKNVKPVVLLDDIFSELDEYKKKNIIRFFDDKTQIFITTTEINEIDDILLEKADVFVTNKGTFKRRRKYARK